MPRSSVHIMTAVLLLGRAQLAAQAPTPAAGAAPARYVRPAPPGALVDIGAGRRLHVECKGPAGGPTVIVEAGLSQFTAHGSYGAAQDSIATFARVCTYDRAGLGWSDPATDERTHDAMVDDLRALRTALRIRGPLVLVGHSMGGLLVRRYAQRFPGDVQAVVLVDATPEAALFTEAAAAERRALVEKIDAGLRTATPGVPVVPMSPGTAPEVMLAFTPEVLQGVRQEYAAIDRVPAILRGDRGYGTLGDRPLVVVRRGRTATPPTPEDERWRTWQESLLSLSSRSRMVVAERAGHAIPYDRPDVIATVVRDLLRELPRH